MAHDDDIDPTAEVDETPATASEQDQNDEAVRLDAYDLDHDGKISLVEDARATLGVVDARLEELAEEPGLKGRLANTAHKVTDKLDND